MASTVTKADDFIKAEIAVWGIDYIESLYERGYEPVYISARKKWYWLKRD